MHTIIEVTFKNEKGENPETFTAILSNDEVVALAKKKGIAAANKAIDGFIKKFQQQFKDNFSKYLNTNL
jgi:hypothetical protein